MRSIGVLIPTLNAEKQIYKCLSPLLSLEPLPKILIIDSSSDDRTVEIARNLGVEVKCISRNSFNHGATRELGRRQLGTDIIVCLTQDAFLSCSLAFTHLIDPILNERASISYARQVPHINASIFEKITREFNYPLQTQLRSIEDKHIYGMFLFFCSDSCAAYNNKDLDIIGGFPTVITGEDFIVTAKLLLLGRKIEYVSKSIVNHSHKFNASREFKRYFDKGYLFKENSWIIETLNNFHSNAFSFFFFSLNKLVKRNILLIPYLGVVSLMKLLGYSFGLNYKMIPKALFKHFSDQSYYWSSTHYINK